MAHLESVDEARQLKQAIDRNDIERVKTMMTRNPALHRAPLGYGQDGPLTWVAECRVPGEPPGRSRLVLYRSTHPNRHFVPSRRSPVS